MVDLREAVWQVRDGDADAEAEWARGREDDVRDDEGFHRQVRSSNIQT